MDEIYLDESNGSIKEEPSDDKEKEKDRPKDREKEVEKTKVKDKEKEKEKSSKENKYKDKDKSSKEKSKDKKKDENKEKSDKEKEKSSKEKYKDRKKDDEKDKSSKDKNGSSKEKDKDKKKDDDKDKSDKDKGREKDKSKDKPQDNDKKDDSKDDSKAKKDRSSKSRSRSHSHDRKRGSQSPPRKMMNRRPMKRLGPFLARRLSGRPNPVLLRRIETERAQRRRNRDRDIEAKRRRIELIRTQREVERKAQEERDRLEREMAKLRFERERLEREKAELLRLEREKARFERERIEREREDLRRKQFQIPHRIDDSPRGRSGISKRSYDSRSDSRDIDIHWDDRKRMSVPIPVTATGRPSFNGGVGSRMPDFDARHGHSSSPYDKGASYRRIKLDNPSGGALRGEYDSRRDSGRHGSSSGHDRDDRRNAVGPSSGSGYYRDSSRMTSSSRDRDRRGGGGRDDWKGSHDNRRDRYLDKGLTSMGTSYSTGASYSGGNSGDWTSGDRGSSSLSKLSIPPGPSVSESRSRGAGLGSSLMTSGAQLGDLYDGSSSLPMAGIMSHGGIGSTSGLTSDERPYMHTVRRF